MLHVSRHFAWPFTASMLIAMTGLATGCGGGAGAPTAPTPVAATTTPITQTTPPPAQAGNAAPFTVSLTAASVQSQTRPEGTILLASPAAFGGAVVSLSTSDTSVARVPATVTVPAGLTSSVFLVDTSTVTSAVSVVIVAAFAGTTQSTVLTVTPPPLTASFVVRSPSRGLDACVLLPNLDELDCVLDGRGSSGFVDRWAWTYTVGTNQLGHTTADWGTKPQTSSKCAFLATGVGGVGPEGEPYLRLEIGLQVLDTAGNRSALVQKHVRLYPNRECGFTY